MYNYYEQSYPNIGTFYHLDIGTVSDEEYDKLKPIIEHLGGHWREKFKCFVFGEDVRDKIDYYLEHGVEVSYAFGNFDKLVGRVTLLFCKFLAKHFCEVRLRDGAKRVRVKHRRMRVFH